MPWARLEDGYFTHHKVADLSKDAKLLDLAAIAFSARELRDGELTRSDIRIIAAQVDVDDPVGVAKELVAAERWACNGNGYVIHDYLKYNPSREKVLKERAQGAKRLAEWRKKHASQSQEDPPSRNGVTRSVPDPVPDPDTRNPVPSPVPASEPGDARAARGGSECQTDRSKHPRKPRNRAPTGVVPGVPPASEDLRHRIQAIGHELGDDNVAASITRACRYQAAEQLEDGRMAHAVKDAFRRTRQRMADPNANLIRGSPMAYFLGVLEHTTREHAAAQRGPPE